MTRLFEEVPAPADEDVPVRLVTVTVNGERRAADLAAQAAQPQSDHRGSADYKRHVVHTFVTRLLTRVVDGQERAA